MNTYCISFMNKLTTEPPVYLSILGYRSRGSSFEYTLDSNTHGLWTRTNQAPNILINHTPKGKSHQSSDLHIDIRTLILTSLLTTTNYYWNNINIETNHEQTMTTQWTHPLFTLSHLTIFSMIPFLLLLLYIVTKGIVMNMVTRRNNYILAPMLVQFLVHHLVHLTTL